MSEALVALAAAGGVAEGGTASTFNFAAASPSAGPSAGPHADSVGGEVADQRDPADEGSEEEERPEGDVELEEEILAGVRGKQDPMVRGMAYGGSRTPW